MAKWSFRAWSLPSFDHQIQPLSTGRWQRRLVLSKPALKALKGFVTYIKQWLNPTARPALSFGLRTDLQRLLQGLMSDGLTGKSGVTLLIPVSLRLSA